MNGAHDVGGMMGYGPVIVEPNEPVFHHPWEARLVALAVAVGRHGGWNVDEDRRAFEDRSPVEFLNLSYYEKWLAGFSKLLADKGLLKRNADRSLTLKPQNVEAALRTVGDYARPAALPAKFGIGMKVRTRNMHPAGHTRLPRYLRKAAGEIAAVHGAHVYPDSNAHGRGEDPQWLYTVRFTSHEVWGNGSTGKLHADLWEPYLEPA